MIDPIEFWLRMIGPFVLISAVGGMANHKWQAHVRELWFAKDDLENDPVALTVVYLRGIIGLVIGLSILASAVPLWYVQHAEPVIGFGVGFTLLGALSILAPKWQVNYIMKNPTEPEPLRRKWLVGILYPALTLFGLYISWLGWSPVFTAS